MRKSTMHDLALPKACPTDAGAPAARWWKRAGSDRPNNPRLPARSHSRRVTPSHKRAPESWIVSIAPAPSRRILLLL